MLEWSTAKIQQQANGVAGSFQVIDHLSFLKARELAQRLDLHDN